MASSEEATRIVQLAETISNAVRNLDQVLKSQGLQTPSFKEDAPTSLPEETLAVRSVVLDATLELYDLLLSPMELLVNRTSQNSMVPFQFISHLGIVNMIPSGGRTSFEEIATKTGLSEVNVRRVLRHAMTMRFFQEPEPGMVAHTNISKAVTDPSMNDWLKTASRDLWPAATKMFDAAQKWPNSQEINETAFSLAHNTDMSVYGFFQANPDRALDFVGSLKALTSHPEYDVRHVVDNYDWESLGQAHVVDVGGSRGNVSIQLAKKFPRLNFLVQDKEEVIQGAENELPEELKSRISFAAHDIMSPQTAQADLYYLRWILHNWPDKYLCVIRARLYTQTPDELRNSTGLGMVILRALIPVLKHNTRIVIQEACMPEPGEVPLWKENRLRAADLSMTALFNARDRTSNDWRALFSEADSRFVLKSIIQPPGSALAILDLRWNAEG